MSSLPKPRASGSGLPRAGGSALVSSMKSKCEPVEVATSTPKSTKRAIKKKKEEPFVLPAFSIPCKVEPEKIDQIKKKTIRRNAPPGEDIKEIKRITASLCGQETTVHEYVGLVGAFTGDNGNILRLVLAEDLASFRGLARKIYETMTQDVSDVLINEQIDLTNYYKEKQELLQEKMMRAINEIYELAPNFDFQEYYKNKDNYLDIVVPIPAAIDNPEEIEAYKRQAAYHRLQWLRSEGIRLNEENQRLKDRLNELKRLQKNEYCKAANREETAAMRRQQLECQESQMKDHLEHLSESMEKTIVQKEAEIQEETNIACAKPTVEKKKSKAKIRRPRKPEWNQETAADLERANNEGLTTSFMQGGTSASESIMQSESRTGFRRPRTAQKQKPEYQGQQTRRRSPSPFHYSPPKSPEQDFWSRRPPTRAPSQQPEWNSVTTRVQKDSETMEERPAPQQPRSGRRGQVPRDSWGGFC